MKKNYEGRAWKLYDQGLNDVDIAEACGVSKDTIRGWRHRNNLPTNMPVYKKRPLTKLEHDELEARKRGMSYGTYMNSKRR